VDWRANQEGSALQIEDAHAGGVATSDFLLLSSHGALQLRLIVPVKAQRRFSEEEVAKVGTAWNYSCESTVGTDMTSESIARTEATSDSEDTAAEEEIVGTAACRDVDHNICGICMQAFDEGHRLTSLPCSAHGCPSFWHLSCIHKWQKYSRNPSCPLCREQISLATGDVSSTSSMSSSVTGPSSLPIVDDSGPASSWLSDEITGVLLSVMTSRGARLEGIDMPIPRFARMSWPINA
jgi:hypothetical protein